MTIPRKARIEAPLRNGLMAGVLIALALVMIGWRLVPTASLLSVAGACLILAVYGLVTLFGVPAVHPETVRLAGAFGLLAGAVFAGEILLEYLLLPRDNTSWGLVEFGIVFFLYFLSGLWVSYRSGRIRDGLLAAIVSAVISALIWIVALLITFYIFRGTDRQAQVLMAEGSYQDFAQSGSSDFNAWIIEDLFGAAFFHLLLGPVIAALLGTAGGLLGRWLGRIVRREPILHDDA